MRLQSVLQRETAQVASTQLVERLQVGGGGGEVESERGNWGGLCEGVERGRERARGRVKGDTQCKVLYGF